MAVFKLALVEIPVLSVSDLSLQPALLAVLVAVLGWLWLGREAQTAVAFDVAYPEEALPGWRGRKLEQPSLDAHLADPTLLPPAAAATSKEQPYITCFDPSTNEHIATVPADTASTIDDKVRAAGRAQKAWTRSSFGQRRTVMRSLMRWVTADMAEISRVGMRDTGKTVLDSGFGEILTTCSKLDFMIKHGEHYLKPESRPGNWILSHKVSKVYYEPLGVVAACVSWNYPFHNGLSPIIASLFTGNAVVLKCSEQVAWSSRFFIGAVRDCLAACGHDPDLVQLVVCYPEQASALTEHPLIRHITFIGSEQVGRIVAASAARNLTPCCMELGGKDPAILLPSADIKAFESTFMRSVFQSAGQGCIATERFIVHRSLLPALVPALKARIDSLRLGSSLTNSDVPVECGSMISDARFDDLESRVKQAVEAGAELICGGSRQQRADGVGAFFRPTFLANVDPESAVATEEVFGPIMLLIAYDTVDEAIAIANSSRYGLGAAVYGRNKKEAMYVARELECGMVSTNDFGVFYLNQAMPFGGCKASGYGRFGGPEGLRGLCNLKSVITDRFHGWVQTGIPPPVDYPVKSAAKSAAFVQGLVRLFYFSSVGELLHGVKQIITGSI